VSNGFGRDTIDDAQLVQRYLKDVGIEAELKIQEHGAYMATTMQGKFEGLVRTPFGIAWEPDASLYRAYAADTSWNIAHVNDPKLTALLKEERRTQDLAARKRLIYGIQRYVDQQYYLYLNSNTITTSGGRTKNFAWPGFDYGNRAAALAGSVSARRAVEEGRVRLWAVISGRRHPDEDAARLQQA
jgi:ABC-type transport system substrate-binding protein